VDRNQIIAAFGIVSSFTAIVRVIIIHQKMGESNKITKDSLDETKESNRLLTSRSRIRIKVSINN